MIVAELKTAGERHELLIPERLAEVKVATLLKYEEEVAPLFPEAARKLQEIDAQIAQLRQRNQHPVIIKRINALMTQRQRVESTLGEGWEEKAMRPFIIASVALFTGAPASAVEAIDTSTLKALHAAIGRALDTYTDEEVRVRTWVCNDGTALSLPQEEMADSPFIEFAEAAQLMSSHASTVWTAACHVACVLWRDSSEPYDEQRYYRNQQRLLDEPATILLVTAFFLSEQASMLPQSGQNYLRALEGMASRGIPPASVGTTRYGASQRPASSTGAA